MSIQVPLVAALGLLCAVVLGACQSTQETSKLREQEAVAAVKAEAFSLGGESKDVKVLDSGVLTDDYGSAVVARLQNSSNRTLVNVPILADVLDAKGKSVYRNDTTGLEPSLNHVPLLKPGETVYWVNDQVQATGTPKSVNVKVGTSSDPEPARIPELTVSSPQINQDPSGVEVEGRVTNNSQVEQPELVLFAVARSGNQIVAAGRGQIKALKPEAKPGAYNIFFIGNPRGAEVEVTAPPTVFE